MTDKSTIALQINTGTADSNGMLMILNDRLVAILVELSDPVHEQARGRWSLELSFGISADRAPETFADLDQAWNWLERSETGASWGLVGSERNFL